MARPPVTSLVMLLLAVGCGDAVGLITLRQQLIGEFHNDDIGVTLTDGLALTVTLVDTASATASCDSLAAFAIRVATAVHQHYPGFDTLQTVGVVFARRDGAKHERPTPLHLPFRFGHDAVITGRVAADSLSAVRLCELDADQGPGP